MMKENKPLTTYVAVFVDELVRSGVTHMIVSPGSRSTPIAMVAAEHPNIKVWINVDERSAAFFALGMAKANRAPVALICTSGTAVANYMPAVVEAKASQIPLIILTADRPHELRDVGAPQAIDQLHFFGNQVKWFVEMALPEDSPEMIRYARTFAARAAATSLQKPSGPVHVNLPFREPLIPIIEGDAIWKQGRVNRQQFVQAPTSFLSIQQEELKSLAKELQSVEKGLIICGPCDQVGLVDAVTVLSKTLNFPLLADPLSQLRSGEHAKDLVIDSYDTFLRDEEIANQLIPDVVIRIGAMPVSKSLFLFLKNHPEIKQIIIDGEGLWRDPSLLATLILHIDPVSFCDTLHNLISSNEIKERAKENKWLQKWLTTDRLARENLQQLGMEEENFEGRIVLQLLNCLPNNSVLFVGNSMPIRDVDSFFFVNNRNIRIMANRGANGIDGTISTALGASTMIGPVVLLVGDLTFYHDLNGLLAAKLHQLNITIIVINNDGGGIFSFLPQKNHPKHFEQLFGTPLGLDYSYVVKMYGGQFERVEGWEQFSNAMEKGMQTQGLNVIEIRTERSANAIKHQNIWNAVNEKIKSHWNLGENNVRRSE